MKYNDLIDIFKHRDEDESNMGSFYKIFCHKKLPNKDRVVKVIWDIV